MVQRKKIIERQQNEHTIALEGQHPQVRKFAIEKKTGHRNVHNRAH